MREHILEKRSAKKRLGTTLSFFAQDRFLASIESKKSL